MPDQIDPTPVIKTIEPDFGAQGGGNDVMLYGEEFASVSQVTFGDAEAEFTPGVGQPKRPALRVKVPAAAKLGSVDVVVTTPMGESEAGKYTYVGVCPACGGSGLQKPAVGVSGPAFSKPSAPFGGSVAPVTPSKVGV
jgi:hypothetical protein